MLQMKKDIKNEKGEIMLEALIVYTVTIFLLFLIISIFCILFQRWNIQTIANESATRVAQTYRLIAADESTGYVTKDELLDVRHYRYIWDNSEFETAAKRKIEDYASWRLAKTTFTKNVTEPQFNIEIKNDSLSRRHIEVAISGEYAVPFAAALSYFGFNSTVTYEVKAYAECMDLLDYINTMDFAAEQTSLNQFGSTTVGLINSVLRLFNNILSR